MTLFIGSLLCLISFLQFAVNRDKRCWVSRAIESFRYCVCWGYGMLGTRLLYIGWYGSDEPGLSLWAQIGFVTLCVGHLGLQLNALSLRKMHVPRFIREKMYDN